MLTWLANLQNAEKKLNLKQKLIFVLREQIAGRERQVKDAVTAKQEVEASLQVTEERLRMAEKRIQELEGRFHELGFNVAKMDTLPQDWVTKALQVFTVGISKKKCKAIDAKDILPTQMQNIASELRSAEVEEFVEF